MEMGKEIRRLRSSRGLTQEALADALHVTAQTVSKWECGNTVPDVQLLPEIAVYFGVSIDQLFAMTPDQQAVPLVAGSHRPGADYPVGLCLGGQRMNQIPGRKADGGQNQHNLQGIHAARLLRGLRRGLHRLGRGHLIQGVPLSFRE